jgi:hypothetical protein
VARTTLWAAAFLAAVSAAFEYGPGGPYHAVGSCGFGCYLCCFWVRAGRLVPRCWRFRSWLPSLLLLGMGREVRTMLLAAALGPIVSAILRLGRSVPLENFSHVHKVFRYWIRFL